jgi:Predicted membrane protein
MNNKTENPLGGRTANKKNARAVAGEIGLVLGLLTDALGVVLILKADFGYSPVVSVQYALSQTFQIISIGTWSYITQAVALMVLVVVLMDIKPVYGFSMILAVGFGYMIDLFHYLLSGCPTDMPFRVVYFLIGFFLIALGIALFMLCKMPLLPVELMLREVTEYKKIEFRRLKTGMDVGCVVFTAVLTFAAFDMVKGLGIGTILSALLMGTLTQFIRDVIAKNIEFYVCTRFLVR